MKFLTKKKEYEIFEAFREMRLNDKKSEVKIKVLTNVLKNIVDFANNTKLEYEIFEHRDLYFAITIRPQENDVFFKVINLTDNIDVGSCVYTYRKEKRYNGYLITPEDKKAEIDQIDIDYPYQKKGLGSILIKKVEEHMISQGIKAAGGLIYYANRPQLVKFYGKNGYEIINNDIFFKKLTVNR